MYEFFASYEGIRYSKAITTYLFVINNLAVDLEPDQLEYFLFTFGNQLSELRGEECYDDF
jgi:hypothetical protein